MVQCVCFQADFLAQSWAYFVPTDLPVGHQAVSDVVFCYCHHFLVCRLIFWIDFGPVLRCLMNLSDDVDSWFNLVTIFGSAQLASPRCCRTRSGCYCTWLHVPQGNHQPSMNSFSSLASLSKHWYSSFGLVIFE